MLSLKNRIKVGVCGIRASQKTFFHRYHASEVQQTFYDPPSVETLRKWRETAGNDFDFTLKAWQIITHEFKSPTYKRMRTKIPQIEQEEVGNFKPTKWVMYGLEKTLEAARILSAKVVVFQCPASFLPTNKNIENLLKFMEKANELKFKAGLDARFAWEPRGEKWTDKIVAEICKKCELIHAVDPFIRKPVTERFFYFRLHGGYKYQHIYRDDEFEVLTKEFQKYEFGYCMFNNMNMLEDALRLIEFINKSNNC